MKIRAILLCGAVLFMLSSCGSTEEPMAEPAESSPVTVSFSISADRVMASRASGTADAFPSRAFMYVVDLTSSEVLTKAKDGKLKDNDFHFSIELDRNHKYDIAFWADAGGYVIDEEEGLAKITYKPSLPCDDKSLVAYTERVESFAPTGEPCQVELVHAVAKLIIKENAGLEANDKVEVSFTGKNYSFSAIDGEYTVTPDADGNTDRQIVLTHTAQAGSDSGELITAYMLAPNEKCRGKSSGPAMMVDDFLISYTPAGDSKSSRKISLVTFKSNYRTVIAGSLVSLSKVSQDFTVSIDESWNDMDSPGIDDSNDVPAPDDPVTPSVPEIALEAGGTLTEAMLTAAIGSGSALKISGPMADADFGVLRTYLSANGTGGNKGLSLDLTSAQFSEMPRYAFSNGDYFGKVNPNPVSGLCEIDLPEGMTDIPECAFADCTSLERVGLPSTVIRMWGAAFYRTALKRLDAPSLTTIYENVFESCHQLTDVTVGNLVEICMGSFRDCVSLRTFDMTRCTKVPAQTSHNIFGNNNDRTPDLTIYVSSGDILNTLSADPKWNITQPKWAIGTPSN